MTLVVSAWCSGCALVLGYGDPVQVAADGGADAAPAIETSALPFCESRVPKPAFCSSFDGASLLAGWGGSTSNNTKLERDAVVYASAPASLRVSLARTSPSPDVVGDAFVDFEAWASRPFTATIGLDVRIEAAAPTNALAVIATPLLIARPGGPSYLLQLVCRPLADGSTVSLALVEVNPSGGSSEHRSSQSLTTKAWTHLDLVVALGAQRSARLSVDGAAGFEGPLVLDSGSGVPGSSFGISTVDANATTWTFGLDNVTVDLR